MDAMNGALNFASITRVDDNIESKEIEHVLQSVTERIKFFGESAKKRLARIVKRSSMSDNLSQDE